MLQAASKWTNGITEKQIHTKSHSEKDNKSLGNRWFGGRIMKQILNETGRIGLISYWTAFSGGF